MLSDLFKGTQPVSSEWNQNSNLGTVLRVCLLALISKYCKPLKSHPRPLPDESPGSSVSLNLGKLIRHPAQSPTSQAALEKDTLWGT